jgi:hypothetical protein
LMASIRFAVPSRASSGRHLRRKSPCWKGNWLLDVYWEPSHSAREYWQGLPLPLCHPLCHLPRTIAHARQKKYSGRRLRPVVGTSIPCKVIHTYSRSSEMLWCNETAENVGILE